MTSIALPSSAILSQCASRSLLLSSVLEALIGWNCHFSHNCAKLHSCIEKHEDRGHCMSVHGKLVLTECKTEQP